VWARRSRQPRPRPRSGLASRLTRFGHSKTQPDRFGRDAEARAFVVAANKLRRNLSVAEWAMVAAAFATLPHGGNRQNSAEKGQDVNLRLDSYPAGEP
jgi:hypothetical protein